MKKVVVGNRWGVLYRLTEAKEGTRIEKLETKDSITVEHSFDQIRTSWGNWIGGELVQRTFPYLGQDEREFIQTGMTPAKWNEIFKGGKKK